MNYEEFYAEYMAREKEMRDQIGSCQKYFKRAAKEMENGDLKNASKSMASLQEMAELSKKTSGDLLELAQSFDMNAYICGGEFAEQMLACCEDSGIDAKGENNVYEIFPYKVRLDGENAEVSLDRKKTPYLRPKSLVKYIKAQREKLMEAPFSPHDFAAELSHAYDLAITVHSSEKKIEVAKDGEVYLFELHKYLTPMKRFRRDYDVQNFAFDIARLISSGIGKIADGRSFQFGPNRKNEKAIRVVDRDSNENYFATVRFFES